MNMLAVLALALSAAAAEAGPAPAAPKARPEKVPPAQAFPGVETSTGAAWALTVGDLYNGTKYRDPFAAVLGAGRAEQGLPEAQEGAEAAEYQFSIHALNLKGIMQDRKGSSAILVDVKTGQGYLLRNGRLFDYKDHRVPDVRGVIHAKQKSVILITPEKDVQTLFLGEEEGDAGKSSP